MYQTDAFRERDMIKLCMFIMLIYKVKKMIKKLICKIFWHKDKVNIINVVQFQNFVNPEKFRVTFNYNCERCSRKTENKFHFIGGERE